MATNIIITRATETVAGSGIHLHWAAWAGIAAGGVLAVTLFKPFFRDWSGFWDCIVFWLKPDWISWFQGEGVDDWWAELKLGVWIALSAGGGFLTYLEFPKWFPSLAGG